MSNSLESGSNGLEPAEPDNYISSILANQVLNALPAYITVVDQDSRIVAINDAWKHFSSARGIPPGTTGIGCNYFKACKEVLSSENIDTILAAQHGIERVLRKETDKYEIEYPCLFEKIQHWYLMRCTLMQDKVHAVICHIDITEQKKAELELRKRDDELQAFHLIHRQVAAQIELEPVIKTILDQILQILQPDLAMLFLKDGDSLILKEAVPSLPKSFCHNTIEHYVGNCLCGLAVESRKAIFSLDIQSDTRCTMNECKEAGYRSFASIPLTNGTDILGCISISSKEFRDFSERRDFLEAAARDVTLTLKNALLYEQLQLSANDLQNQLQERKRLERVLVESQKLEAIGHLAGGIAHDFNNILAAIMGYSELALKKAENEDSIQYLRGSLKACHRAKDLIQQILTFSRKSDSNLMPLDLRFIIKETLPLIRASLPSSITVVEQLDTIAVATIRGNPTQLQRVFMNICSNGAQAMHDSGGMLIVKLADVIIDKAMQERCPQLKLNNPYVELSIRDTGTGIASEHMGSIFEPYFSTKVPEKGTGLGLAVVHGVMRHHHGGVIVESFPDHGSIFSLYFPRVYEDIPVISPSIRHETPKGSGHILIIDDEASIVHVLEKALKSRGYTVTCSQFAKEAMTLFRKSPEAYDLVLCDLTMPDISGDILTRKMRAIRADIPIILCTGHSTELLRGIDVSHIDKILQKPIPQAELTDALEQMLAKKQP